MARKRHGKKLTVKGAHLGMKHEGKKHSKKRHGRKRGGKRGRRK